MKPDERLDEMLRDAAGDVGRIPSVAGRVMQALQGGSGQTIQTRRWWRPVPRWALVAAAIVVCVGAVLIFLASSFGPGIAWADVSTQVAKAGTVVFLGAQGQVGDGEPVYEHKYYIKSPNIIRWGRLASTRPTSSPEGESELAFFNLFNGSDGQDQFDWIGGPERIVRIGTSQASRPSDGPMDLLKALKAIQASEVARDGEETVDGVKTVKFETALQKDVADALRIPRLERGKLTAWVSKASSLPVRVHISGVYVNPEEKKERQVDFTMGRMQWNVPLPDDMFEIPKGRKVTDYWVIDLPNRVAEKDFKFEARLADGKVLVTDKDGTVSRASLPGMFGWRINKDRQKALEELTAPHVGSTIVLDIAGTKFERKIRYPIGQIHIGFHIPPPASQTQSAPSN